MGNSQGRSSSAISETTKSQSSVKYPESRNSTSKKRLDHQDKKRNLRHQRVEFDIPEFLQEKQVVEKSQVIQRHPLDQDRITTQEETSQNRRRQLPKSELQAPERLLQSQHNSKLFGVNNVQRGTGARRTPEDVPKKQLHSSVDELNTQMNSLSYKKSHQLKETKIDHTRSVHSRSLGNLHGNEFKSPETKPSDAIDDFGAFTLRRNYKTVPVENGMSNNSQSLGRLAPGVMSSRKYVINQPSRPVRSEGKVQNNSHLNSTDDDSLQSVSSDPSNSLVVQQPKHSFLTQDKIQAAQGYESPDSAFGYIADSSLNNPDSSIESGKKITRQNSLQAHLRQRVQDYERDKHQNHGVHVRCDSDCTTISDQSIFGEAMSSVMRPCHPNFVHINSFQDGILLKVFSYLNTIELCKASGVCRRWRCLAWDPILWNTIEILNYKESDVNRVIRNLLGTLAEVTQGYCLTIHSIRLNGCDLVSDKSLGSIARYCIDLENLELNGCCCVTSRGLQDLLLNCHNLTHLDLSGCTCVNSLSMANSNGFSLENTFLKLCHLDLSDCVAFDDYGLRTLGLTCGHLESLYLRRCSRITDVGIKHVASHCHHLKELSTSDCFKVRDFSLKEIAKNSPCLRYLSVAKCSVSDTGIKYIGKHCVRLKYLNVRGCEAVTDIGIAYVVQNCLKLRSIDIGKCSITDSVLHTIGIHCPQLKKLSIRGCMNLTDEGIRSIAAQCCNLQYFNVQECNLSYDTFTYIREHCRNCIIEHTCPAFF